MYGVSIRRKSFDYPFQIELILANKRAFDVLNETYLSPRVQMTGNVIDSFAFVIYSFPNEQRRKHFTWTLINSLRPFILSVFFSFF